MPSSSFIVNSEFQPMSYQELLHPVITQTQYLRELDEKYTQLDLQADKLEQLANSAIDAESYAKYKNFANRLREEANNLSKYGLRGRDSARFMEMFRNYGKEILPLLDALTKRERMIELLRLMTLQDPTSLFDRSAGNISLQEIMANPSAAPIRLSGELLRQLSSAMAKNLINEIRTAQLTKTESPGFLAFKTAHGLSSSDVEAFLANPNSESGNKVLRAIYDLVMTASGITPQWENNAYDKGSLYVGMGLWSAVGQQNVQPIQDAWTMLKDQQQFTAGENAKQRALDMWKVNKEMLYNYDALNLKYNYEALQEAAKQKAALGEVNIKPISNYSPKDYETLNEELDALTNTAYPFQGGKSVLNKDGLITEYGMRALLAYANLSPYFPKDTDSFSSFKNKRKELDNKITLIRLKKMSHKKLTDGELHLLESYDEYKKGHTVDGSGENLFEQGAKLFNYLSKYVLEPADILSLTKKGAINFNTYGDSGLLGINRNPNKWTGSVKNKDGSKYDLKQLLKLSSSVYKDLRAGNTDLNRGISYRLEVKNLKPFALKIGDNKKEVTVYDIEKGKAKNIDASIFTTGKFDTTGGLIIDVNDKKSPIYTYVTIDGKQYKLPISKELVGESAYDNIINNATMISSAGTASKRGKRPKIDKDGSFMIGNDYKVLTDGYYNLNDMNDAALKIAFDKETENYLLILGRMILNLTNASTSKDTSIPYSSDLENVEQFYFGK